MQISSELEQRASLNSLTEKELGDNLKPALQNPSFPPSGYYFLLAGSLKRHQTLSFETL